MILLDALLPFLQSLSDSPALAGRTPATGRTPIISLAGAGGKTTVLFALAREAARRGLRTLATTTTMMMDPRVGSEPGCDQFYLGKADDFSGWLNGRMIPGSICFAAREAVSGYPKVKGFAPDEVCRLARGFDLIIVEADGANHRLVKAPAEHEPAVPPETLITAGLIGLDCLGRPIDDRTVHRPELFSKIVGLKPGESIEPRHLIRLIESEIGLFKGTAKQAAKVVLFNTGTRLENRAEMSKTLSVTPVQVPDLMLFASITAGYFDIRTED